MAPLVSFVSLLCYLPLTLLQEFFLWLIFLLPFLQDSCVLSPSFWFHLSSFSSGTSLASAPSFPSGASRSPYNNAALSQASFSDPPSHLTTLSLTSKQQGREDVGCCLAGNEERLEVGDPGIGCCWKGLSSDLGQESHFIAVSFCCLCWVRCCGIDWAPTRVGPQALWLSTGPPWRCLRLLWGQLPWL